MNRSFILLKENFSNLFSISSISSISFMSTISSSSIEFDYFFVIFLLNFFSWVYIFLKFFKLICYAKLTCEWFPLINPYEWPFCFFQQLTGPYFGFWSSLLPTLKFQKSSVDISAIIGLEALNAFIYFCVKFVSLLIIYLENTETTFPSL
jgi:uncharacterized protein YggT (Ycf19 family)